MLNAPTLMRRIVVALLAIVVLVGFQSTLLSSVRCANAKSRQHATSTIPGQAHLARAQSDDGASHVTDSGSTPDGSTTGQHDHRCPSPLGMAFIAPAVEGAIASWTRTTFAGRAPPEPTRNILEPQERPPRNERGLLSA